MHQFILLPLCHYLCESSIVVNVATAEGKNEIELKSAHWIKYETGVATQSWLWVQVELMRWLSRLECLKRIQSSFVQILVRPIFYGELPTFSNFLQCKIAYIYQFIPLHRCYCLCKVVHVAVDVGNGWNEIWKSAH